MKNKTLKTRVKLDVTVYINCVNTFTSNQKLDTVLKDLSANFKVGFRLGIVINESFYRYSKCRNWEVSL
jgi:hypothetical protein